MSASSLEICHCSTAHKATRFERRRAAIPSRNTRGVRVDARPVEKALYSKTDMRDSGIVYITAVVPFFFFDSDELRVWQRKFDISPGVIFFF